MATVIYKDTKRSGPIKAKDFQNGIVYRLNASDTVSRYIRTDSYVIRFTQMKEERLDLGVIDYTDFCHSNRMGTFVPALDDLVIYNPAT